MSVMPTGALKIQLQLPSYQEITTWQNRYHPILPFCFFTIRVASEAFKTFIIKKKGVIPHPQTLGQHLRNRRLILGLHQEDVARQLGTLREVYERWERDEHEPVVSEWPAIIAFLGYYPAREENAADLVLKARRCRGMDQKSLARTVGVIHQRLRRWETWSGDPHAR
jgi:DNA-binding transcriptional regulator YiaG